MSSHPINLIVAFLLELLGLLAIGIWGWLHGSGWVATAFAVGLPVAAASVWGIFRFPNDPGRAIVPIPGFLRLLLEWGYYAFAVWALFDSGLVGTGTILAVFTAGHYVASYDRVLRLLKGRRAPEPAAPGPREDGS